MALVYPSTSPENIPRRGNSRESGFQKAAPIVVRSIARRPAGYSYTVLPVSQIQVVVRHEKDHERKGPRMNREVHGIRSGFVYELRARKSLHMSL